jgi:hypothetical protein
MCTFSVCSSNFPNDIQPTNDTMLFCHLHVTLILLQSEAIERRNAKGLWRFCQQCGKLEPLTAFDSNKRCVVFKVLIAFSFVISTKHVHCYHSAASYSLCQQCGKLEPLTAFACNKGCVICIVITIINCYICKK